METKNYIITLTILLTFTFSYGQNNKQSVTNDSLFIMTFNLDTNSIRIMGKADSLPIPKFFTVGSIQTLQTKDYSTLLAQFKNYGSFMLNIASADFKSSADGKTIYAVIKNANNYIAADYKLNTLICDHTEHHSANTPEEVKECIKLYGCKNFHVQK